MNLICFNYGNLTSTTLLEVNMEKKLKHRLIGISLLIAVIISLLAFLRSGPESASSLTVMEAPPFPDESLQVSSQTNALPDPIPNTNQVTAPEPKETSPKIAAHDEPPSGEPDDFIGVVRPNIVAYQPNGSTPPNEAHTESTSTEQLKISNDVKEKIKPKQNKATVKKTRLYQFKKRSPIQSLLSDRSALDQNGLSKLQDAAWVIQIGTFKRKHNAIQLVNRLRSNGYPAFMQRVEGMMGETTRVFVGPENKQVSARALQARLTKDFQVEGIVISYQPFAL